MTEKIAFALKSQKWKSWEKTLMLRCSILTDFSCRLQAEHDGYLPWNNWIKLLYQKWLWFSNSNSWLDFGQKLFEARKSWEKSVEKKVFCCWWCSKWTLKVLWEIDKKSLKRRRWNLLRRISFNSNWDDKVNNSILWQNQSWTGWNLL